MSDEHYLFRERTHEWRVGLPDGREVQAVTMWLEGSSGIFWEMANSKPYYYLDGDEISVDELLALRSSYA